MDPKRTREALVTWDNAWVLQGSPAKNEAEAVVVDAARWAVDLFVECENCKGTGDGCASHGQHESEHVPCPSCKGRGFSLNRERVRRAAKEIWRREGFDAPLPDAEMIATAEAAISAFLFGSIDSTETRQEGER